LEHRPILRRVLAVFKYGLIAFGVLVLLYFAWLREWQMTWGATDEEVSSYMAGDELLEDPTFNATRAVEIEASPEEIWPWIVQMGYGRAGFYAFDKLDNGGVPSAERILPEYQHVQVGDSIPLSKRRGRSFSFMEVVGMEPNKSLLWVFRNSPWRDATWSWGLYEVDSNRTRLVSRLRNNHDFSSLQSSIMWAGVDVLEIVMMRTCLLGIKRRAEAIAGAPGDYDDGGHGRGGRRRRPSGVWRASSSLRGATPPSPSDISLGNKLGTLPVGWRRFRGFPV
jgi:hypothetical protein